MFKVTDLSTPWVFAPNVGAKTVAQFRSEWETSPKDVVEKYNKGISVAWQQHAGVRVVPVLFGHGEWELVADPLAVDFDRGHVFSIFEGFGDPPSWKPVSDIPKNRYQWTTVHVAYNSSVRITYYDFFTQEDTAPPVVFSANFVPYDHESTLSIGCSAENDVLVGCPVEYVPDLQSTNAKPYVYVFRPEARTALSFRMLPVHFHDCLGEYRVRLVLPITDTCVFLVYLPFGERHEYFAVRVLAWDGRTARSEAEMAKTIPTFTSQVFPQSKLECLRVWLHRGASPESATLIMWDGDSLTYHSVGIMSPVRVSWLWMCLSVAKRM